MRLLSVIIGGLLSLTVTWAWIFGLSGDTTCIDIYPRLPEGSFSRTEGKLWPPGTKCVYELPSGRVERRTTFPRTAPCASGIV